MSERSWLLLLLRLRRRRVLYAHIAWSLSPATATAWERFRKSVITANDPARRPPIVITPRADDRHRFLLLQMMQAQTTTGDCSFEVKLIRFFLNRPSVVSIRWWYFSDVGKLYDDSQNGCFHYFVGRRHLIDISVCRISRTTTPDERETGWLNTSCLRASPRSNTVPLSWALIGHRLPRMTELRYLGVYFVSVDHLSAL